MSPAARVLVVNTGSSSLKYQLIDPGTGSWVAKGLVERIGESAPRIRHERPDGSLVEHDADLPDHAAALSLMLRTLGEGTEGMDHLVAVGHRVVHGGSEYREPAIVDEDVEAAQDAHPRDPLRAVEGLHVVGAHGHGDPRRAR